MYNHIFKEIYKENQEYAKLYYEIKNNEELMMNKINKGSSNYLPYDVVNYQWKLRDKMAMSNDTLFRILKDDLFKLDNYLLKLNNNFLTFNELIRNEIKNIIENFTKDLKIIEFDMKELRINKSILDKSTGDLKDKLGKRETDYVYVLLRSDGMVVCVGESTYTQDDGGDLFRAIYLSGASGNEKIILSTVYGEEIYDTLRNYYDYAFIIPVEENARDIEKGLGNYLIENKVPILNYFSHMINNSK
ncbi:hypothetical protein [Macrococcoides canis]|uniref:hypothetical protein n=1 Tax=Macrococcoides canis TaxID=1855823 RepID=UPI001AA044AA|nr:hypothetical protein [Macrococcus canis]